jgi:hypothetical protein
VVSRFAGEFDKLLFITLMSPWGEELDAHQVEQSIKALAGPDGQSKSPR